MYMSRRQKDIQVGGGKDRQRVGCQRLRRLALQKAMPTELASEIGNATAASDVPDQYPRQELYL